MKEIAIRCDLINIHRTMLLTEGSQVCSFFAWIDKNVWG